MVPLVLVIALALAVAEPSVVRRVPIGERDSLTVAIAVPPGWGTVLHPRGDSFHSHRAVIVAINNQGDDSLCVTTVRRDLGGGARQFSFGPEAFEVQLAPGAVYVDLAYAVGGPRSISVPYAWTLEEQPAVAIQNAIREPAKEWTTNKVVIHRATFVHWGRSWDALVAARKPYSEHDLARALSALESLQFPDRPVRDPRQAVEVAIRALPAEFRDSFREDPSCGCCRLYEVDTIPIENGFHVTFNLMESQTRRLVRSMAVDVHRDGRAELR